jgi:hypothetical protein
LGLLTLNLSLGSWGLSLLFTDNFLILAVPVISFQTPEGQKLYAYHPDKKTLAFVFGNIFLMHRRIEFEERIKKLTIILAPI